MSKLFKLREWLSIEDAANHLSGVFDEVVKPTDLMLLALEGKIRLSLRFPGYVTVRSCKREIHPHESGKRGVDYVNVGPGMSTWLLMEGPVLTTNEVLDLSMLGGERECLHRHEWDPAGLWNCSFDELIMARPDGSLLVLLRTLLHPVKQPWDSIENFGLAYTFPEEAKFVVRTAELRRLETSAADDVNLGGHQSSPARALGSPVPWPSHSTPKLEAMRLAAFKFWANFDPSDRTTESNSAAVVQWLEKEHGIKRTVAESMASILRPDLPPGPKPKF